MSNFLSKNQSGGVEGGLTAFAALSETRFLSPAPRQTAYDCLILQLLGSDIFSWLSWEPVHVTHQCSDAGMNNKSWRIQRLRSGSSCFVSGVAMSVQHFC